ncbi:MAG: alpha/beta hydrolase [Muribaculaceae bacterium]|nr:alpha/beta hydrolase [Muribaculaceae bacterium]
MPDVSVSECINDAAEAVKWVMENISEYGGDPSKIFVSGHSAGGFLTSMIGLDKSRLSKPE